MIYFVNFFTGLKNDTVPETFRLKHVVHDHYLPVNYVKITPLECWKPSFNFSIYPHVTTALCTVIYFVNFFTGLKNDTVPETFRLKHVVHDHYLPVNYVKITPLECWKPSFNFSIWYVSLEGDDTSEMVQNSLAWHDQVSTYLHGMFLEW